MRSYKQIRSGVKRRLNRYRLVSQLPKRAVGAEVGTWKGDFSALLLRLSRPKTLYLIDPWAYRDDPGYEGAMYGGRIAGQSGMDAIYDSVRERFQRQEGRVIVLRETSTDAAEQLAPDSLDWVYIDGDHNYESVKADLAAYHRLVRPGGVIAGDDYAMNGWWASGVVNAVDEFAETVGKKPLLYGNQFLFRL
jgi:hypothetical protein